MLQFFCWSRDRTENGILLYLIALKRNAHNFLRIAPAFRGSQPNICQKATPLMDDGQFSFR
jgi:hypothetical protein